MQVFPSAYDTLNSSYDSFASSAEQAVSSAFSDMMSGMNQHVQTPEEYTTHVNEVISPDNADDLRDTRVSEPEYNEIRDDLKDLGASDKTLRELDEKMKDGTLTWNGMMQTLSEDPAFSSLEAGAVKFDEATRQNLSLFMQKLGFDSEKSSKLIAQLENGDVSGAWKKIQEKLNSLPEGKEITLSADEMLALGKAMRLGKDATKRMLSLMGGQDSVSLDSKQLQKALNELSARASQLQEMAEERAQALKATLEPLMDKAKERASQLEAASKHDSRDAKASDALIKDTVTAKAEDRNGSAFNSAHADEKSEKDGEGKGENAKDGKSNAKGWEELLNKVTVHPGSTQPAQAQGAQSNAAQRLFSPDASKPVDQRIFEQVQTGMLRSLKDGTNQMTLRLDPPELGRIAVALSVKGNEVSAVIRPESQEAAQAINNQLHQLKTVLENQGLKVERLDVQTQLNGQHNGQNWQGASQHNLTQQEQQRLFNNSRLRNLRTNGSVLAREMPIDMQTARNTREKGLHIIA